MTLAMVQAIVGLLLAFGAEATTTEAVRLILMEKVATTTEVIIPQATTTVQITPTGQVSTVPQNVGSITPNETIVSESKARMEVRTIEPTEKHPYYTFWVRVFDQDGTSVLHAPVKVEGKDGVVEKTTNQRNTKNDPYEASISYGSLFPLSQGEQTVTITSGEFTESVTITIE